MRNSIKGLYTYREMSARIFVEFVICVYRKCLPSYAYHVHCNVVYIHHVLHACQTVRTLLIGLEFYIIYKL